MNYITFCCWCRGWRRLWCWREEVWYWRFVQCLSDARMAWISTFISWTTWEGPFLHVWNSLCFILS